MKKLLLVILFISTFSIQPLFSCTLAGKSIGKFERTEYIFIGEVIGYTKTHKISESLNNSEINKSARLQSAVTREGVGLIVKVTEAVFLPKKPREFFEVFPIELWADCSIDGVGIDYLKKNFPLNSEIRVIAKESQHLPSNLSNGNIRLENSPDETGSIALNHDKTRAKMTSAVAVFDYKSFVYDSDKDSDSTRLLPNFEIRKDLLRLEKARNQTAKNQILDRLFYAPVNSDLNFYQLFESYSANQAEAERYNEDHIKMTSPEFYEEQYKPFNNAKKEIIKRGYSEKSALNALGKVIAEETELSTEALAKRSLEILAESKKKSVRRKKL